jgi:hypothetical protein
MTTGFNFLRGSKRPFPTLIQRLPHLREMFQGTRHTKKRSLADNNISAGKVLTLRGADDFPVTGSHLVAKAKALFTVYCSRKDRAKQPIHPSCCATLGGRFTNPRTERRGFGGRCRPRSFAGSYDTFSSFAHTGGRYHPRRLAAYSRCVFAAV